MSTVRTTARRMSALAPAIVICSSLGIAGVRSLQAPPRVSEGQPSRDRYQILQRPLVCIDSVSVRELRFPDVDNPVVAVGTVVSVIPRRYRNRYGHESMAGEARFRVESVLHGDSQGDWLSFLARNVTWMDPGTGVAHFTASLHVPWIVTGDRIIGVFARYPVPDGYDDPSGVFSLPRMSFGRWLLADATEDSTVFIKVDGSERTLMDAGMSLGELKGSLSQFYATR